ncbi:MAG: hypothetical protein IJ111_01505 [Eggerthellaceae bacterium]|nr:hypothetical protein [Eggerthellaceae bacterium]
MSSTVLDRFSGASAWDSYCDRKEREYEALIKGKTCLDCDHSINCEFKGHESVGYCKEFDEFVDDADLVSDLGCTSFYIY